MPEAQVSGVSACGKDAAQTRPPLVRTKSKTTFEDQSPTNGERTSSSAIVRRRRTTTVADEHTGKQLASMPVSEQRYSPFRGRDYSLEGITKDSVMDIYHQLLKMRWSTTFLFFFTFYIVLVTLFAALYALDPVGVGVGIYQARPGSFVDIFFFSAQTISTIGYGFLAPRSTWANLISLLESFVGIVFTAFVTGSLFAKLSRPKARIAFARRVLLSQRADGRWMLVFRVVNQRRTPILNLKVCISVLVKAPDTAAFEASAASYQYRSLRLDVDDIAMFVGGARLRHVIDEASPLYGMTAPGDAAKLGVASYLGVAQGLEEVYGHSIAKRHIYDPTDVLTGFHFKRLLSEDAVTGKLTVHLEHLNELVPVETQATRAAPSTPHASSNEYQGGGDDSSDSDEDYAINPAFEAANRPPPNSRTSRRASVSAIVRRSSDEVRKAAAHAATSAVTGVRASVGARRATDETAQEPSLQA